MAKKRKKAAKRAAKKSAARKKSARRPKRNPDNTLHALIALVVVAMALVAAYLYQHNANQMAIKMSAPAVTLEKK